jgi:uncharacterized protein DUF2599
MMTTGRSVPICHRADRSIAVRPDHFGWRTLIVFGLLFVLLGGQVQTAPSASALTYTENAWWTTGPLGATLHVTPSGAAQAIGISAAEAMWAKALEIAGTPPYSREVYDSLYEQLQCHLVIRLKTPYNLDTWRPKVPWPDELRAQCNPLPGRAD